MTAAERAYTAVLLDAGGVLMLPDHERIQAALEPLAVDVAPERLDPAHYAGIRAHDACPPERAVWRAYLEAYVETLEIPVPRRETSIRVLSRAFASGYLWMRPIESARVGLRHLAASGLRIGVVSNAEGTVEQRLRELALCQVGPGPGTQVEVIIDSEHVGVEKPDPAIFEPALQAMGLEAACCLYVGDSVRNDVHGALAAGLTPVLMDPDGLHDSLGHARIQDLADVVHLAGLPRSELTP
jgi:putative hydrolase of the HAD superfamily